MHHPSSSDRIRRWLAVAGITAVVVVAVAAPPALAQVATLGSPPPEAEASPAPAEALGEQDAMLAWAGCMRDNGVEVTDPVFDASGAFIGGLEFEGAKDAGPKDAKGEGFQAASEAYNAIMSERLKAKEAEGAG